MVLWSASGEDWKNDTAGVVRASLRNLGGGSVLLLHDGQQAPGGILKSLFRRGCGAFGLRSGEEPSAHTAMDRTRTVEALPQIIDRARKAGLEFVSIEGILPSA
jgi:peptidoglycan/xylan/chitin deacetylase (PgdA/CDA1 family)